MRYATEADRTDVAHPYTVHYPSGAVFVVIGVFLCGPRAVDTPVLVRQPDGEALALDPRAVVVRDDVIVYEPRCGRQRRWVRAWLRAHPEWPRLVTETDA